MTINTIEWSSQASGWSLEVTWRFRQDDHVDEWVTRLELEGTLTDPQGSVSPLSQPSSTAVAGDYQVMAQAGDRQVLMSTASADGQSMQAVVTRTGFGGNEVQFPPSPYLITPPSQ